MTRVRTWGYPVVMGLMAAGIVVNFTLLIPLISEVTMQSAEGQDARERQQAVYPVSLKAYKWIESQGGITEADLKCFRSSASCPKRTP